MSCNTPSRMQELWTDFVIELDDEVKKSVGLTGFEGSVLNLLPPGGYKTPNRDDILSDDEWILDKWVQNKLITPGTPYYDKFKNNFGMLAHHLLPNPDYDISRDRHRILVVFLAWTFQHDDILDNIVDFGRTQGWKNISEANQVFCDILYDKYGKGNEDNFPNIDFPHFKDLCFSARDIHRRLHKTIPHYEARNGRFLKYTSNYLSSYVMIHGEKINKKFSEETGKFWLRLSTGWKPWIELICLIRGFDNPQKIRKDWYFIRLRMACEDVNGCINDLFGIGKDLKYGENDTLVMFKHREKGVPLKEAFGQTMDFLNEQLRDVMRLIELLRKRFPDEPHAEGYLRCVEDFVDGYIRCCATAPRYLRKTKVTQRVEELKRD